MDLFFSLVIFTFSQLHVTRHVRLILCHFILTHALLLNLCIHAFPTPFLCGTLFPLILLILMYHNLKMLYEATLCNLCSILVLYIVCISSHCSYYSLFLFFFFLDVLTLAFATCTLLHSQTFQQKKTKKRRVVKPLRGVLDWEMQYTISAGQLNTNTHTYMYLPYGHVTNGDLSAALVGEDGWVEWRLLFQALV